MIKFWQRINWLQRPLALIKQAETEQNLTKIEFQSDRRTRWMIGIVSTIALTVTGAVAWSILVEIDVNASARGRIDSQSSTQVLRAGRGGRVATVLVRDGDSVQSGQTLVQFDKAELLNQLLSLQQQRKPLEAQVRILQRASQGQLISPKDAALNTLPEIAALVRQRNLLNAQLSSNPTGLNSDQTISYSLFQQQVAAINTDRQIQTAQAQAQNKGIDAQLGNTIAQKQIELDKLAKLNILFQQGGISRNSVLQQVGTANEVQKQVIQAQTQQATLATQQQQTQNNTRQQIGDLYRGVLDQRNQIDAQMAAKLREAQDQLVKLNAQVKQTELDLAAQEVKAPTSGTVSDLAVTLAGVTASSGQPLLQVTPNESLIATVEVSPADIANLKVGTPVEVRLDALPFTEFGAVKGSISNISSTTTTNQTGQPFFLVKVRLDQSVLEHNDQRHPLKNGMTLTAKMRLRTQRPIEWFLGPITSAFDGAKTGR